MYYTIEEKAVKTCEWDPPLGPPRIPTVRRTSDLRLWDTRMLGGFESASEFCFAKVQATLKNANGAPFGAPGCFPKVWKMIYTRGRNSAPYPDGNFLTHMETM